VVLALVLRRWRDAHDVTAQQLADRIGVDLRQVQRFEGEEGNPTLETLVRLAAAMDRSVVELFVALEAEVRATPNAVGRARHRVRRSTGVASRPPAPESIGERSSAVEHIAVAIRTRRAAREWTQLELADRAGISRSKVQSIEAQRHAATIDTLDALAAALGCEVIELLRVERGGKR
jgi:transcriptional regulator with XRE-family HTH domain